MNNIEEIIEVIVIAVAIATFLLNTGRAVKAIEVCKESLVLLNNKALSTKQHFRKLIYRRIYETMFEAYSRIRDSENKIRCGKKLLVICCERGETVNQGRLMLILAQEYVSQNKYVEAKELYESVITIMRETGDKKGESVAYGGLGFVFHSLGDYVKAKEYLEKALAIKIEIGDREGEATCYVNLGAVFQSLGRYVKAKEYLEKALAIKMEIGNREEEATCYGLYGYLANVFIALGDYAKAKEYIEKVLAIAQGKGDREGEAKCYGNLGNVLKALGDNVKSKEYLEKALAITLEIGHREGEGACYGNLGIVFKSLGDYVKAKEYLEKSLAITLEIGHRKGEGRCYGNLGTVFLYLGEYDKADECYEKALAINLEIGDMVGEAENYENLGTVLLRKKKYGKSIEYFEKALAMEIGHKAMEAAVNGKLGTVFQNLGDYVQAKEYYEKALAITIDLGDRDLQAVHFVKLGGVFLLLSEYAMAEEYLGKALQLSKDIRVGEIELDCYFHLTLTKLAQKKDQEAISYMLQSVQKCEDLRGLNAESDQIKIYFADKHAFPYELLSVLFCTNGNANNGLYVAELGRASALADLMATQYSTEKSISANRESWIGIENVMTKESNCTCLFIVYHDQRVLLWTLHTSGGISFREMKVDEKILHNRLASPALNLDEFFALMVESFRNFGISPQGVCEDRSLNGIESADSDSSQEESLAAPRRGKDEKDTEKSLTLFHEMLINPVSDLLDEPEIIIVPDRNLYRVPFPALLDQNGKYLSETFRIRIIPSLTTLKLIQNSPADYHSQTGALIVGDPDVGEVIYNGRLNKQFVALPGARKEAEMIGRLLGYPPLLGRHATKQVVLEKIHSVSLIHFAAHGNAERGEIALAPGCTTGIPKEDDFLLRMSDISNVRLRAKLVVLSCCHSGRGQIRAEGVVGIARAFLGSGARSVLVALWALEDTATEQLMSCFYKHLARGESASESLHKAMKWMRDNGFSKVSEWAPFMLIGDNVAFDFENSQESNL